MSGDDDLTEDEIEVVGDAGDAEPLIAEPEEVEPVTIEDPDELEVEPEMAEPIAIDGIDVWTIERNPKADPRIQDYLTDLLNGMIELDRQRLLLKIGQPLPYFGFLAAKPIPCTYADLMTCTGILIGTPPEELAWGAEGVIRAMSGSDGFMVELLFGVEVGPRLQWLRFSRELETRQYRRKP